MLQSLRVHQQLVLLNKIEGHEEVLGLCGLSKHSQDQFNMIYYNLFKAPLFSVLKGVKDCVPNRPTSRASTCGASGSCEARGPQLTAPAKAWLWDDVTAGHVPGPRSFTHSCLRCQAFFRSWSFGSKSGWSSSWTTEPGLQGSMAGH